MFPKNKNKFIGVYTTLVSHLKPEYRFGNEKKDLARDMLVFIEIREHKKYGARAELFFGASLHQMLFKNMSPEQTERFQKRFNKISDSNKRVDTSKWLRPDRKSIRNELVKSLFALELLEENCQKRAYEQGRVDALYSLLNTKSPRNPQSFANFAMMDCFSTIMQLMKVPEHRRGHQITFPNYGKGPKKGWFGKIRETEEARKMYQEWKSSCLKEMIVKGDLHHHIKVEGDLNAN